MVFYHTEKFYPKPDLEQFSVTEEKCTETSRSLTVSLEVLCIGSVIDGDSHYHLKITRRRLHFQSRPSLCG